MDRIKIALVGAGTWGSAHASIYAEYAAVELTAICDTNIGRAQALAKKHGVPENSVYKDYNEMLEKADCDAVAIVTPDFAHRDIGVAAANCGKHMIIEKPLATTYEETVDLYRAIKKSGVRAMVDFHNRWNPPFSQMREDIAAGGAGLPYSGYIRLNDTKWVVTDLLPWCEKSSVLWFLGSHSLDTLRWIFGSEVKRLYAVSRSGLLKQQTGRDVPDIYQTTLEFENGCIAQMENGWITPNGNPNVNDFKCNITCENAMYNLDLSNHNVLQKYDATRETVPDILVNNFVRERAMGFAYQSIRHFVDGLLYGRPFYVSMEDAANVSFTILKIFESVERGTPVDVVLPDYTLLG